jgi:hypothetical protein
MWATSSKTVAVEIAAPLGGGTRVLRGLGDD